VASDTPVILSVASSIGGVVVATANKRLQQDLSVDDWSALIVQSTGEAIVGFDVSGRVASWNAAAERMFGHAASEVLGRPGSLLTVLSDKPDMRELQLRALHGEVVSEAASDAIRKDGTTFPASVTIAPVRDGWGGVIGTSYVVRDLSDRTRFEHELRLVADHDPLTGLVNHRRFMRELARHTAFIGRYQIIGGGLLVAGVDGLKTVNDALGHSAGDELLRAVATALRQRLRDTDVLGRLGGDEFAILLPRATLAQGRRVAEMLRAATAEIELTIKARRVRTSISIGVTVTSANFTPEELIAAANRALYRAKQAGGGGIAGATAATGKSGAPGSVGEPARLLEAIREDDLKVYWQPIVDLGTGAVLAHELFVRIDKDGQLLPPRAFIPVAERLGLLDRIDRYGTRVALTLLEQHPDGDVGLHVNLSGSVRAKSDIIGLVASRVAAGAVDSRRLTFEIAESAVAADAGAAREFAVAVRELGARVALDHFGSGSGSFAQLDQLPLDHVKIHGRLIAGLPRSQLDCLAVRASVDVARGMDIEPIAQRVASQDAVELLAQFGVQRGQGPYLGRTRATVQVGRRAV
jgi:diguanylate cyclase (GGDEF)-like protein/PAS domain S-box-containing protein